MKFIDWVVRIIPAAILLQTLYFKFTASPESVFIFSTLGVEPWGRLATAVAELMAALLLLVPRSAWAGALMAIGLMVGAIFSHLFLLGIEVMDDGGLLFGLGVVVLITSAIALYIHRERIPVGR